MTDTPFTETHRRLTQALLDYWVRHKSTKPGEVGTPSDVFYNVETAVNVLVPVFDAALAEIDRLTAENERLRIEAQAVADKLQAVALAQYQSVACTCHSATLINFVCPQHGSVGTATEMCHDCGKLHATCDCGRYERGC